MLLPANTEILTDKGFKTLEEGNDNLFCTFSGGFVGVKVASVGQKSVYCYTLIPHYNQSDNAAILTVLARPTCVTLSEGVTWDLRLKDRLPVNTQDMGYDANAWGHGFLMAAKTQYLESLDLDRYPLHRNKLAALIDTKQVSPNPVLPSDDSSLAAKASWIKGHLTHDGWMGKFTTTNEEHAKFFVDHCNLAGLVQTGKLRETRKSISINRKTTFYTEYTVAYFKGNEFKGYRVADIIPGRVPEEVYNVTSSHGISFVLRGGILLRNS